MRELIAPLLAWYREGQPFALATVVRTWRSAPRQPGAVMAVSAAGEALGSVSGGCVEGAVYELAQEVLRTGVPELASFGVSDDDAFAVGLTCGGTLQVFVQPVTPQTYPEFPALAESIQSSTPVAIATLLDGANTPGRHLRITPEDTAGALGSPRLNEAVRDHARGMLALGSTGFLHIGADGEQRGDDLSIFVESFAPPPRMLVFGAIDFAGAVARIGKFLGYHVTVCDARPVFATAKRFPEADELVVMWPHKYLAETTIDERTAICVLTHDPKFDVPLLELALRTNAAYIGAMGSRRTHEDRLNRLRELGLTEPELSRLSSPIGLDLGARTPEETAVSIAAEIISLTWGGSGRRLAETDNPIHRPQP
ncbi:XdhC family protein [Crossiella cryophila]|uniref:Xanthine dehydrogenase accessory factor n=1 Tax=Crossiella cryophila TaxID=43355 RepID=A0A7W7FYB4_9PSEU|nr:XdhC family protein [Crossiella cryophila]MBB4681503.1 xanthine dehydrogenase accessory factor [Crossiella cryophila]